MSKPAFARRSTANRPDHATVTAVGAGCVSVNAFSTRLPSVRLLSPITTSNIHVGDTVFLVWINDIPYVSGAIDNS